MKTSKEMKRQNYHRHQESCFYKNEIGVTKHELDKLIHQELKEEVVFPQIEYETLKGFFKNVEKHLMEQKENMTKQNQDPYKLIEELNLSESTKKNYYSDWNQFDKFVKDKKLPLGVSAADTYITTCKCCVSTKITKRNILQIILRQLLNNDHLKLKPLREKFSVIPKYTLSDHEVEAYLAEQEEIGGELYLAQLLMITYGLRVSTPAALKKKHLEFLYTDSNKITLPDVKSRRTRTEEINDWIMKLLEEQTFDLNEDDYIFLKSDQNNTLACRAHQLGNKINNRLKSTKAFKKSKNYKYTSHIFRKTKANQEFKEKLEQLKDETRNRIGHSKGSTAVSSYIEEI